MIWAMFLPLNPFYLIILLILLLFLRFLITPLLLLLTLSMALLIMLCALGLLVMSLVVQALAGSIVFMSLFLNDFNTIFMKYTLSPMFSEIRGKIGTFVASKNRSGSVLRVLVSPRNTITTKRTGVRSYFSNLGVAWVSMVESLKNDWRTMAVNYLFYDKLGVSYVPSAYQLFVAINLRIQHFGLSLITSAPSPSVLQFPSPEYNIDPPVGELLELFDWSDLDGPNYLLISASAYQNAGKRPISAPALFLTYDYNKESLPLNLFPFIVTLNGRVPVIGERIFITVVKVNGTTGQQSLPSVTLFQFPSS